LIDSRLLHWLNYRYGLKGYLHWGFNAWTNDPVNAPGDHRGDGWHLYPKKDGLLDSLRWEQIIQTNPPEHSLVANNCSIDVHGWAEPGAKLKINGREVPVAADGLVVQETPPSREGTVTVEVENRQGRRSTVRKFRLQFEPPAKKS